MSETDELAATAAVLGLLWLREVDREVMAEVVDDEVRAALAAVGLELPAADDAAALDALAADYFAALVQPEGRPPPVQSLVQEGKYEGEAARGIRTVAEALGADFDREVSRGAPADHLGAELALWSELRVRSPESAPEFATHFLSWAAPWCRRHAGAADGFYGRLFQVTAEFLDLVLEGDRSREPDAV